MPGSAGIRGPRRRVGVDTVTAVAGRCALCVTVRGERLPLHRHIGAGYGRHLQREVNFWSIHVLVHRHDRHGGPEREGRRRVRVQCRFVVEVWRQGFDSGVSVWGHGEV